MGGAPARALDGLPGGRGLNIAHEAVDRHAPGRGRARRAPLARQARRGRDFTYASLARADEPLRQRAARRSASARATASSPWPAAFPSSTSPRSARSRTAACSARCSPPSAPSRSASRLAIGQARVLVTTGVPLPAEGRRRSAASLPGPRARPAGRRRPAADRRAGHAATSHALMARGRRPVRDRADRPGGPGAAPLHQRHDRHAEGRDPRARGRRRPPRHRAARARPPPGRRLLVHRRSRLGDRHLLRHHRPADQRRDEHRRRGRLRRRALVPHPAGRSGSPSGTPRRPRSAC